jgi:aminoglycoside/choline kinase family phosphotransferase
VVSHSEAPKNRQQALQQWAARQLPASGCGALQGDIRSVSGDASFRRYFRGHTADGSWILVDAPPDKEDSGPFIDVDRRLQQAGVRVPDIVAADAALGFMCLQDFGDTLLWPALEQARLARDYASARGLYQTCFDQLLLIQQANSTHPPLPAYDAALLLREMRLFTQWFCAGLLGMALSDQEQRLVEAAFQMLCRQALQQAQTFVHRDYHSRNLMLLARTEPAIGVIDFQDAVRGPWTYDLVSLLKDCYIEWPRDQVNEWALAFARQAQARGLLPLVDDATVLRDFDLMGAQRHIKVLGIFSRLWLRDGKPGYLKDIPLTYRYLQQVVMEHDELASFAQWLHERVEPQLGAALDQATVAAKQKEIPR